MLAQRGVISPRLAQLWGLSTRLTQAFTRKESLSCANCGAKLRARRMAATILGLYPTDPAVTSIAAWTRRPNSRALRVAEFNRIDGLHEAITALPNLAYSEFREGALPGTVVDGIPAEDLTSLSFPSESFDLILTSETLEHVPDLSLALAEIWRVLVPGGIHVFTVPLLPSVESTFSRAVLQADGSVRHLATPIHHPGGDVGYLVFTEFGADLPAIHAEHGFEVEVEVRFGPITEDDVAQVYIARKPHQAFESEGESEQSGPGRPTVVE
jgi:SAM-dependent methyltransferase